MSTEDRAVLDSLAAHVDLILDHWYAAGHAGAWQPTASSHCTFERTRLLRKYGPGGAWDDSLHRAVLSYVQAVLATSAQHLDGMAALLRAGQVVFPLALPTRSILEAAGYVCWLLDPRVDSRTRAARILLAQLDDLHHAKMAAGAFGHPSAGSLSRAIKRLRNVTAPSLFYPSERSEGARPGLLVIRDQSYPGLTQMLDYLVGVHGVRDWNARGMYAYLSNGTHPTPHYPQSMMQRDSKGGRFELPDATMPYRLTRAAIMSFIKGWTLHAAYLGHDEDLPGDLGEALDDLPTPGQQ